MIGAWGIETDELREGLELEFPGGHTYVTAADDTMHSIAVDQSVRMASVYAALDIDPLHPPAGTRIEVPQGATGITIADASRLVDRRSPSVGESIAAGWTQTRDTFILVRNRIRAWIAGGEPIELSGPVGIARVTGEVVDRAGWVAADRAGGVISL